MYIIYHLNNIFKVEIETNIFYDIDEYNSYVILLKSIYIQFDGNKYWNVPNNKIDEFIMWVEYYGYDYKFMPTALQVFNKWKEDNFKRETVFQRNKQFDISVFSEETQLFNYLKEGCNWAIKRNRAYIADDAGLGKTVFAIGLMSQLYKENIIDGIFLIVRNGTSYNWKKEINKFSNIFNEEDITLIFNENKIQSFNKYKESKIIIIANHLIKYLFASYRKDYDKIKNKLSKIRWNKPFVNILKEWDKKSICLIIDEAHELNNSSSIKYKSLLSHKEFFNYRYLLSATPAINFIEKYWAQCKILDESIIPYSENAFKIWLSESIGNKWGLYNITEYNSINLEKLQYNLSPFFIRRLKRELPEIKTKQTIIPIFLDMSKKHKELYRLFIEYIKKELELEYDIVTPKLILENKFSYIIQILDNPLLLEGKVKDEKFNKLLKSWKIEDDIRYVYLKSALKDYVENLNEKVIIFDYHPKTMNMLYDNLKKYNPLLTHGQIKETDEEKFKKQEIFNDKNSKNMIYILSTIIGGPSWNLHKACKREICYTLHYNAVLTQQSFDRTWRATSEHDSIIEILILDKSLDVTRYIKNVKKVRFNNDFLTKHLSNKEIDDIFFGKYFTNN